MKILTVTTEFPNRCQPNYAVFTKERMKGLTAYGDVRVVAPLSLLQQHALIGRVPARETIEGLLVDHPWFSGFPKVFKFLDGLLQFLFLLRPLSRIQRTYAFDLLDIHWAYPDAFSGWLLSRWFHKPFVVTVLGSDIHVVCKKSRMRRTLVLAALRNASRVIALSEPLKQELIGWGLPAEKVIVIPNGVDPKRFHPMAQKEAKGALGLSLNDRILLSVGRLEQVKGFHLLIEAVAILKAQGGHPSLKLYILGNGSRRTELERLVARLGVQDSVTFMGEQPHETLKLWYNAADLFTLASSSEGCPNVVCESVACGLPVVASRVGGIPEMIRTEEAGSLVSELHSKAFAAAIEKALGTRWNREQISATTQNWSWEAVSRQIYQVFQQAVSTIT